MAAGAVLAATVLPNGVFVARPVLWRARRGFARWELGRRKLKNHLAGLFVPRQMRFEATAGAHGDKLVQQIGLAGFQQLGHLLALDRLLQDDLAALEVAARRGLRHGGHGLFADVVFAVFKHRAAAFGAGAQAGLAGEIDDLAGAIGVFVVAKVKFQLVVFGFFVELDDHFSRERPARFGAEAVQAGRFCGRVRNCSTSATSKVRPAGVLPKEKPQPSVVAGLAGAGVAAVVFFDDAAAVRAGRFQGGVVAGNGVAVVFFGFFDHALGHGGNFGHEGVAAEFALLHLRQLVFPLAGQLGFGQLFHAQAAQQRHQLEGFGGRNQLAAFAQHVFFGDQALNRRGAGGWRAQAFFLHGFAQLVVVNRFAGAFHRAQQRRL